MEEELSNIKSILNSFQVRLDKLEKENSELKELLKNKIKNDKILRHNQENRSPSINFYEWIDDLLNNVEFCLDTVFESDLISGIEKLLKDSSEKFKKGNLPIIAYNRKPNIFYYYTEENGEGKWSQLDNNEFITILKRIEYWFVCEFNRCWYKPNMHNIQHSEEYKNKYDSYYFKILGGNISSDEQRYKRILQTFYKIIRE